MKGLSKQIWGMLLFISFTSLSLYAQNLRMGNPKHNQAHPQKHFGADNYFFLRAAANQLQSLNVEDAFFSFENAVAQNPQSADAIIQRAKFRKMLGMKEGAATDQAYVNRLNPYAADLFGYNGPYGILNVIAFQPQQAVLGLGINQRMAYYYDLFDQLYQEASVQIMELEYLEEVVLMIEDQDFETANILLATLLIEFPNSALAYDLKGLLMIEQGQYSAAAQALAKAVVLQPNLAIAWCNFSRLERLSGHYGIAKIYPDRAIHLQQDLVKAYFERALLRKSTGDAAGAIEAYTNIIARWSYPGRGAF